MLKTMPGSGRVLSECLCYCPYYVTMEEGSKAEGLRGTATDLGRMESMNSQVIFQELLVLTLLRVRKR